MSKSKKKTNLLAILDEIKAGARSFKRLNRETKLDIVQVLLERGLKSIEISAIAGVDQRTVQRYVVELREQFAMEWSPALTQQILGAYFRSLGERIQNLRRIAQDKATPAATRVEAETRIFQVGTQFIKTMQSLGFMPSVNAMSNDDGAPCGPVSITQVMTDLTQVIHVSTTHLPPDDPSRKEIEQLGIALSQIRKADHNGN